MIPSRSLVGLLCGVGLLCLGVGADWGILCPPANTIAAEGVKIDLKAQLEAGLKARLPREFAFISHVAQMVELGQLPRELVDSTFLWARPKKPYPFPYFEAALRVRAAQRGISI